MPHTKRISLVSAIVLLSGTVLSAPTAWAGPVFSDFSTYTEVSSTYNAVIFDDIVNYSLSGVDQTDIEGAVAVGGSLYGTGGQEPSLTIGYKVSTNPNYSGAETVLVVGGDLHNRNNTIFGSAWVGGDATLGAGDPAGLTVQGNLTVHGDLDYNSSNGGGNIGQTLSDNGTDGAVVVGGNATFGHGSNVYGSVHANGNITVNGDGMGDTTAFNAGGTVTHNNWLNYIELDGRATDGAPAVTLDPSPVDFVSWDSGLKDDSLELSQLTANTSLRLTDAGDIGNGLGGYHTGLFLDTMTYGGPGDELIIFDINLSTLAALGLSSYEDLWANGFSINSDSDAMILINIAGTEHVLTDFGFFVSNEQSFSNIVFNFFEATNITLGASDNSSGIGFKGNILSPYADISFYNGLLEGNLFARSLTGNGQINMMTDPDFWVDVPEPGVIWLMLLGLCGGIPLMRRRTRALTLAAA